MSKIISVRQEWSEKHNQEDFPQYRPRFVQELKFKVALSRTLQNNTECPEEMERFRQTAPSKHAGPALTERLGGVLETEEKLTSPLMEGAVV